MKLPDSKEPSDTEAESTPTQADLLRVRHEVAALSQTSEQETELVLVDVDPTHLYAFWHVRDEDAQKSKMDPLMLRVYGITRTGKQLPHACYQEMFSHRNQQTTITLFTRHSSYVAELGIRNPNGTLRVMARSKRVTVPSGVPAKQVSVKAIDTRAPTSKIQLSLESPHKRIHPPSTKPDKTVVAIFPGFTEPPTPYPGHPISPHGPLIDEVTSYLASQGGPSSFGFFSEPPDEYQGDP